MDKQRFGGRNVIALLLLANCFLWVNSAAGAPLNILYFGNSFTLGYDSSESIPDLVRDIAVAAGYDAPSSTDASTDGADFEGHASVASGWAATLPLGQNWDFVVMQDYSTGPTHVGSLANHLYYGQEIYQQVTAHSPDVIPVLFETWARGPGHEEYTGPSPNFPGGPTQMQAEIRSGYLQLAAAIGPEARIAAVGDAFEATGFSTDLYGPELWHAQNLGTLIASLVIFESIYGLPPINSIDLSGILANLDLTPADGVLATAVAGMVAVPEPSTLALCSLAVAVFAARGWRRLRPSSGPRRAHAAR